jgi:MFS family permease
MLHVPASTLMLSQHIFLSLRSAFRLIGIGMGTWAIATFGCGLAVGFKSLIFCRMLVGVGEASFVALAAPFIGGGAQITHAYMSVCMCLLMRLPLSAKLHIHASLQRLLTT